MMKGTHRLIWLAASASCAIAIARPTAASPPAREGVPFARLWESKSVLISLGLNQSGKPGLWLMQKTP